jgi:hypothetical protein
MNQRTYKIMCNKLAKTLYAYFFIIICSNIISATPALPSYNKVIDPIK